MANPYHNAPYSEPYQNAAYNGFPFLPEFGPRRTAPREEPFIIQRPAHHSSRGGSNWYQGPHPLPRTFRPKKYWVRPIDHPARRGTLGRLKDALSSEGPDVFVVTSGDRRTLHRERPGRLHWSNWDKTGLRWVGGDANWKAAAEDMDWFPKRSYHASWAKRGGDKEGKVYNFRTREYEDLKGWNRKGFWSDAHYPREDGEGRGKGGDVFPTSWRGWDGKWFSTVDERAGLWPGGRPLR